VRIAAWGLVEEYEESEVLWPNARGRADGGVSGKDVSPNLAADFSGKNRQNAQCGSHMEEMDRSSGNPAEGCHLITVVLRMDVR